MENGTRQAFPHKDKQQSQYGKHEDDNRMDNEDYRTTDGYSLPDLNKPVPDDWETVEGKKVAVLIDNRQASCLKINISLISMPHYCFYIFPLDILQ